jgi:DNA-binding NtrC family response regulator
MERAYILSSSDGIMPEALQADILTADILPEQNQQFPSLDEVDKKLIIRALQLSNGHIMETAKLLKIGYGRLHRLIAKYNLRPTYK